MYNHGNVVDKKRPSHVSDIVSSNLNGVLRGPQNLKVIVPYLINTETSAYFSPSVYYAYGSNLPLNLP